jgi:hypothetical protein
MEPQRSLGLIGIDDRDGFSVKAAAQAIYLAESCAASEKCVSRLLGTLETRVRQHGELHPQGFYASGLTSPGVGAWFDNLQQPCKMMSLSFS